MDFRATLRTLAVDGVTAEIVSAFQQAGVPSILLKGPSTALWLYPGGAGRPYVDSDILVPPTVWARAEQVLVSRGFANLHAGRVIHEQDPGACAWRRTGDGATVDLHRRLRGARVDEGECWRILLAHRESMSVGGVDIDVLAPAARALNLALHAAHDGVANQRSLSDLVRALYILPESLWEKALGLAVELQTVPSFAAGLRLVPSGIALADRLRLPASSAVDVRLHAMSPPPLAMGFAALHELPGLRQKVGFLARNLIPTPAYIRFLFPLARRGRLGFVAAYLYRWLLLLWHALPSYRAWRRAYREDMGANKSLADSPDTLSLLKKLAVVWHIWSRFISVQLVSRRYPLPEVVSRVGRTSPGGARYRVEPARLGWIVKRSLQLGGYQPRCLTTALVLYRLLREQGLAAQLVIGLPPAPTERSAHAWVEVSGTDVGPPPGRSDYVEFARYG